MIPSNNPVRPVPHRALISEPPRHERVLNSTSDKLLAAESRAGNGKRSVW